MAYALLLPEYRTKQGVHTLDQMVNHYADAVMEAWMQVHTLIPGRDELRVRWVNRSKETLHVQLALTVRTDFVFTHYVIPGVSLNGNEWGNGREPKGLIHDGQPWIFDARRTTIPGCTISENADNYLALFASDKDEVSHNASCSMEADKEGHMRHRLLYPLMEGPVTYCTRDGYAPAHEDWLTLAPGACITTTAYILTGSPTAPNFATADVENAALSLLGTNFLPRYTPERVAELCYLFSQRLTMNVNGRTMFSIGQLPNAQGVFENREGNEFGWCGQNGLYALLLLERGLQRGERDTLAQAVSNLDGWSHEAVGQTGLIHTHYHWMLSRRTDVEDTCNQGFAIRVLSKAWQTARAYGLEKRDWLQAAKNAARFLMNHWSEENGFGKAWNVETGECTDPQGTIGAYIIPGLTALYRATGEVCWLESARKAARFYRDRDLAIFQCTAGALDTYCIDKESSGPLITAGIELYAADGAEEWLELAKLAGWYFCSWMFHHDVPLRSCCDFDVYHYRTLGGTTVSTQHHHIDPWGALVVPQLLQLACLTGDEHWRKRAMLMWANAIQNIAPEDGVRIHGHFRAAGSQNEGYHHCNWGEPGAPGYINDWLVAWPQAFCWLASEHVGKDMQKTSVDFSSKEACL